MATVKPEPARTYAGQTGDQRASDRRQALLEAAFDLVGETGWSGLRIETLCRRAGLNKRYFYESFPTLDALSAALIGSLADETIRATLEALSPDATPDEATRQLITAFVAHLTDEPRRARVLFGAIPPGEIVAGHRAEAIHRLITTAASVGQGIHELPDSAPVQVGAAVLVGGTSQALLDWLDGRIAADQAGLIALLVRMWQLVGREIAELASRSA